MKEKEKPRIAIANIEALKSLPVDETKINWDLVEKIRIAKLKNKQNA